MTKKIRPLVFRFCLVFIVGFILTLPSDHFILPNFGEILRPVTEGICQLFHNHSDNFLHSDSSLMITWMVILTVFSFVFAAVLTLLIKHPASYLKFWLQRIANYYLSFGLFAYGLNKIFKFQFFFPEPNTLFTPLGQLSPDILFWSSMGTSHSYNIFMGLIEVIPAILLLFRKTRLLGALIALGVLINVVMINFSFGISVKIYSSFLLFLALIVLQPHFKRLYIFFTGGALQPIQHLPGPFDESRRKLGQVIKVTIILLILTESFGPYVATGAFNGDVQRESTMQTAYSVDENDLNVQRVFFHSQGYFIIQTENDHFFDYQSVLLEGQLHLTDYNGQKCTLNFIKTSEENATISGVFFGNPIEWDLYEIDLKQMPIYSWD